MGGGVEQKKQVPLRSQNILISFTHFNNKLQPSADDFSYQWHAAGPLETPRFSSNLPRGVRSFLINLILFFFFFSSKEFEIM